jgi:nucleotide-binding universal stress UspA family protein
MNVIETALPGVLILEPRVFGDARGFFTESWNEARFNAAVGSEVVDNYYAEEAAKVLDPVVKFLTRHKLKTKTISKVGPAGETIGKLAESGKYDMVIMGSRGHGALGSLVMGSVATKVLANCQVPVLLVR